MRTPIMAIQTSLHPLNRADGSATYTSPNGYSILAAVNGPVEVQRRDELPDEAHLEVNIRPHDGVGQVKERHLELLIANTLRDVVFVQMFPRQMVQLTLQIMKVPVDDSAVGRSNPQAESVGISCTPQLLPVLTSCSKYLLILPWLLNAACLVLVDAAIPMRCTFTSTIIAFLSKTITREHPTIKEAMGAKSIHVLCFSSKNELLLVESEGMFNMDEWEIIEEKARIVCLGDVDAMAVDEDGGKTLQQEMKAVVEEKVRRDERWKNG
jgi:exosome complex component RRP46